jgi:hypothetical protein
MFLDSKKPALLSEPVGSLRQVSSTEDRTLYAYRSPWRLARGLMWLAISAFLLALAIFLGVSIGRWYAWLIGVVPLFAAAIAAIWGGVDVLNRPLFQLEVDRRARTLALAMATGQGGNALAKVGFKDVASVELSEKEDRSGSQSRLCWNVKLRLRNGRQIGLGLSTDQAEAEEIAVRFSTLIGVEIVRSPKGADSP